MIYKYKNILEVLTSEQMYRADRLAEESGVSSYQLMRNAGQCIAREIIKRYKRGRRAVILCGRGNNGGDGFVVAKILKARGWSVQVGVLKLSLIHISEPTRQQARAVAGF